MIKYQIGFVNTDDPLAFAMAKQIDAEIKEGLTVKLKEYPGVVKAVDWPVLDDGTKDLTGVPIIQLDHGTPFRVLFRVIDSLVTRRSYARFGWFEVQVIKR